jgi:CRP/FNR family transcriptional regulator, cyclic AMP receptor protein
LLSRVVRIEEDLIDQFFNFSERRLARVLLLFPEITKESKSHTPLKLSQSTLAEMVGTTRPRVSKFMNDFKKKGMVSHNGGLQINSALVTAFLENRPMSVKKTGKRSVCAVAISYRSVFAFFGLMQTWDSNSLSLFAS